MRSVVVSLLGLTLGAVLGWMAREGYQAAGSVPAGAPRVKVASPVIAWWDASADAAVSGERRAEPVPVGTTERTVPHELLSPIEKVTEAAPASQPANVAALPPRDLAAPRSLIVPIAGLARADVRDMFDEGRGDHRHEAIDIMAPRGTPIIATDDGVVKKLFTSAAGGLTVYQFDPDEAFCYYYAHLDRYAAGLHEGQQVRRGQLLGYVGSSGNASEDAPHLHFALIRLDPDKRWWSGTYVNPYPLFTGVQAP